MLACMFFSLPLFSYLARFETLLYLYFLGWVRVRKHGQNLKFENFFSMLFQRKTSIFVNGGEHGLCKEFKFFMKFGTDLARPHHLSYFEKHESSMCRSRIKILHGIGINASVVRFLSSSILKIICSVNLYTLSVLFISSNTISYCNV